MVKKETPVCNFGETAKPFNLLATDGKYYSLDSIVGPNGVLIMFICNHCPYVKAILPRLLEDCHTLSELGIGIAAICSNDPKNYPEDNYENMQKMTKELKLPFPYLWDETQEVAKAYDAVCTPDFFGYNKELGLQYRGRLDASGLQPASPDAKRELVLAMEQVVKTGKGPEQQIPSMGCSIKWRG